MKMVVGLGNPGSKYTGTRHNIGFAVLAELARKHASGKPKTAFQAEVLDASLAGEKVLLVCPQTFMNLSGESVVKARDFYKLENSDLLVVCDDINLPLAKLRYRLSGSSGGQKGLEDIIRRLGSPDVPRLRIGVGSPPPGFGAADYVLAKFRKEEAADIEEAVWRAADSVADWVAKGAPYCMNRYNEGSKQ